MSEIDILKDLVRFNTIKDKQNKEILDYIQKYLENIGFVIEKRDKYLIMKYGKDYRLGFIGHSDTVEYIDGWNTDPFELTQIDNKLYGLGSCDMKGGIAAFLQALSEIDLSKIKYGIKIYITYDEEIGFGGIKDVVSLKCEMPEYILVGEPTDNVEMTGCKGLFAVRIFTNGKKVHSSTPEKGKSANSSMIKLLNELEEYYNKEIRKDINSIYEIPYTTMNIGLINGGSAINSVAASCMSYMDFRTIKSEHSQIIKEKLDELCKKYDARYEIDEEILPFYNKIPFVLKEETAGFMTEASFIDGKRIILGPGPVTAHEIDEHISIESIRKCVNRYKEIIEKVCK